MENLSIFRSLDYYDLGLIDYDVAWKIQKTFFQKRSEDLISDTLLLLEHPNTYTLGKTADRKNLIGDSEYLKSEDINVYDIDRGGDITYHGPGQIVGYPIFDLSIWKQDAHKYLRSLEEVIIRTCSDYGLKTERKDGHTGVWIEDRKICAIGIKISKWITMHGFALNVNTDLSLFNGIIPCGINDKDVTSLEKELKRKFDIQEVKGVIVENIMEIFSFEEVNNRKMSERVIKKAIKL